MNRLVCVLAVISAASAQSWGGNHGYRDEGYRDEGYSAPRRPVVPAPLANDGRVIDTPEIANLKAAHFAAHDAAIKALPPQRGYQQDYRQEYRPQEQQQRFQDYRSKEYRGPQEFSNKINEDYDNYDDRESSGYQIKENNEEPRWRGPLAKVEFTEDGKFIKDTPEVYRARQDHLAALDAARKSPLYQPEPPTKYYEQQQQNNNNYDEGKDSRGYQGNQGGGYQGNQGGYQVNQREGGYDDGQYRSSAGGNHYSARPQGYYN